MRYYFLFILFFTVSAATSQEVAVNMMAEAPSYDFSDLWTIDGKVPIDGIVAADGSKIKRGSTSGIIGEEKLAISVELLSVIQNPGNKLQYLVHGLTEVHGNVCDFQGMIIIEKASAIPEKAADNQRNGTIMGAFKFFEDKDQQHTGIFEGTFETHFLLDSKKNLQYRAVSDEAGNLSNSHFKGIWKKYDGSETSPVSWSDSLVQHDNLSPEDESVTDESFNLGAFSISLNVKDIRASAEFYENLGFAASGGNIEQNWVVMRNGQTVIGLFQGMFPKNMLTFNPGWNQQAKEVDSFTDVREIQKILKLRGISLTSEVDTSTTGPAFIMLIDPDGNTILIDQHR